MGHGQWHWLHLSGASGAWILEGKTAIRKPTAGAISQRGRMQRAWAGMESKRNNITENRNRKWQSLGIGQRHERGKESHNESLAGHVYLNTL